MNILKSLSKFKNLIISLLVIRLLGCMVHIFAPVTMPHTWRQVDTMGVALRYALRWATEKSDIAWWIPAVLNSGDTKGIMSMEFPFINILGSLGFLASQGDVDIGRMLAQALLLIFNLGIGFLNYKQWQNIDSKNSSKFQLAMLAGGILSFATPYSAKFMPDLASMLLAYLGVAGIWQKKYWGILPLALATLIKPTSGVACAILLFHPELSSVKFIFSAAIKIILAAIPSGIWYLKALPKIHFLEELPPLFNLHANRDPLGHFLEFWKSSPVLDILDFHAVFPFAWIVLGLGLYWGYSQKKIFKQLLLCILVLFLQASLIAMMSGTHSAIHSYYLICLAPIAMLLVASLWDLPIQSKWHKVWCLIVGLGLFVKTAEAVVSDINGHTDQRQGSAWFLECKDLRVRNPNLPWHQNKVWRTPIEVYPLVDLCLGERGQSKKEEYGVYRKENPLPAGCSIIDSTQRLNLFRCVPTQN